MSEIVSAAEANRSFSKLLRAIQEGHSYVVTSHGRPVARIVPIDEADAVAAEEAKQRLLERLRNQPTQNIGRWTRDELYD